MIPALAYFEPQNWEPIEIFTLLLFTLGLPVAYLFLRYNTRHPANYYNLDMRIVARAWSLRETTPILVIYFLFGILISTARPLFSYQQIPTLQIIGGISTYTTIILFIKRNIRKKNSNWSESFGMGKQQLKFLLLAPLLYLASISFLMATTHLFHLFLKLLLGSDLQMQSSVKLIIEERSVRQFFYILTAILIAPFYEEVLFRGVFFPAFTKHTNRLGGFILTSALFSVLHFNLAASIPLFMLSGVLCFAYWRTGSLWVCIGMHMIYNAVSIFSIYLSR